MFKFNDNINFYYKFKFLPDLELEEELKLIEKAQNGNNKAREKIVMHNIKILFNFIRSCPFNSRFDENDLFQEGVIALIKAVHTFDLSKSVIFKKYALIKIKKYVNSYVIRNHFSIKVPLYLKDIYYKIKKLENEMLEEDIHIYPNPSLIAERLNLTKETIQKCLELYENELNFNNRNQEVYNDF